MFGGIEPLPKGDAFGKRNFPSEPEENMLVAAISSQSLPSAVFRVCPCMDERLLILNFENKGFYFA